MLILAKSFKIVLLALFISSQGIQIEQDKNNISTAKVSFDFISKDVQGTIEGFESETKYDATNPEHSIFNGSDKVL